MEPQIKQEYTTPQFELPKNLDLQTTLELVRSLSQTDTLQHIAANEELSALRLALESLVISWSSLPTATTTRHVLPPITGRLVSWLKVLPFYDEIYDQNGAVREPYRLVMQVVGQIENTEPHRIDMFPQKSLQDFRKDNSLYHIPRVLSHSEHQLLLAGVDQRARALSAFFKDHYSGSKPLYLINKLIPKQVITQMLRRSSEETIGRVFPTNRWAFWYGPDIIRGPGGTFYVCEDNIGYVGGFGDLACARNSLLSSFPEFSPLIAEDDPTQFYTELAQYYRSLVKPDEAIILLHYPKRMTADNEERRLRSIFKKHSIYCMVVPVPSRGKYRKTPNKTLSVTEQGVVVVHQRRKRQVTHHYKVGLVIIDAEPFDVDPKDSSVKRKMIIDEAKYWLDTYKEKLDKIPANSSGRNAVRRARYTLKYEELNFLLQNDRTRTTRLYRFLRKAHYDDLTETLNQGVAGLLDCYYQGLVQLVNGPGLDFVGDKLFCTYMDNIIEFYLKEKPILSTIPTLSFCTGMGGSIFPEPANENDNEIESTDLKSETGVTKLSKLELKIERQNRRTEREEWRVMKEKRKEEKAKFRAEKRGLTKEQHKQEKLKRREEGKNSAVDAVLLSQVFEHPEVQHHVVIKRVDGRGGDAVWVGPKISREQFLGVRVLVEKNPEAFIVQKYCPLSQVDGQLVDIRCLANVGPDRVIVSQTFWGRGVPADGSNGKVNISDRGFEFCIATAKS